MFVTEVLHGRPYQCFVPKPVIPAIPNRYLEAFANLDRRFAAEAKDESHESNMVEAVLQYEHKPASLAGGGGAKRRDGVTAAVAQAIAIPEIGRLELQTLNAVVVAQARTGLRTGPIWIGAPHPALATHVGSPPSRLPALVQAVVALRTLPLPVSLAALVSLMRLLQVHPFADGNGRTARLYACWLGHRRLGPSASFPTFIAALWNRADFSIEGACTAIRQRDDWEPLLNYGLAVASGR